MAQLSVEMELELLGYVQEQPFLYDLNHMDYKDTIMKKNAWNKIGELMANKPGDEMKKVWDNIKKQYQNYLNRLKGETGDPYKSVTFRHSESMKFYKDCYRPYRTALSNVEPIADLMDDSIIEEQELIDAGGGVEFVPTEVNVDVVDVDTGVEVAISSRETIKRPKPSASQNKVKQNENKLRGRNMNPVDKEIIHLLKESEPEKLDEYDYLGRNIAIKLRRIGERSKRKALQCQIKIDQMFLDFEDTETEVQ